MLVERLKVSDHTIAHNKPVLICVKGTRYQPSSTCARDSSNSHSISNIIYDIRPQAPQVPTTTVSRSPGFVRDMATDRGQSEIFDIRQCAIILTVLQSLFADILSVLAMTYSDTQPRGTLRYRLLSASLLLPASPLSEPGTWGHEYVRHLAAELGEEYSSRQEDITTPAEKKKAERKKEQEEKADKEREKKGEVKKPVIKITIEASNEQLQALGMQCATFLLGHNAEPDAVDLMTELEIVTRIAELVDENTYPRVCQYMIR